MNRPKAMRLGLMLAIAALASLTAFATSAVAAPPPGIIPTVSTVYESTVPGAHTDYTIIQKFQYGNGAEPAATTGAGQDLKKWIADSPAGLIGNPNAIPFEDRCDPAAFDPSPEPMKENGLNSYYFGACPASAQVGEAHVYLVNDDLAPAGCTPNMPPAVDCLPGGFPMWASPNAATGCPGGSLSVNEDPYPTGNACTLDGKIYLLKTDPELPVVLATIFQSASYQNYDFSSIGGASCSTAPATPCPVQPKTQSLLAPVTNRSDDLVGPDDFRIRTIPRHYNVPPSVNLPLAYGHLPFDPLNDPTKRGTPLHLVRIDQHLYGKTQAGVDFLTMPMRCDAWNSYAYGIAWNAPTGGDLSMDPKNPGDDNYAISNTDAETPSSGDCAQLPQVGAVGAATIDSGQRTAYPGVTVSITDPQAANNQQPRKLITTMPASLTVNVKALDNVCTYDQRDADACPAASQVGTVSVKTPLLSNPLNGRVYATTGATKGLPFLSIFVDGPVNFRLDGSTRFVGPNANMIESTFDDLPQTPFTEFNLTLYGGTDTALLMNRDCPTDSSMPQDGPVTFNIAGWGGGASASQSDLTFEPCYGMDNPAKRNHCLRVNRSARFNPQGIRSRDAVSHIQLQIGPNTKRMAVRATRRGGNYQMRATMSRRIFRPGWRYRMQYRMVYKDGTVMRTKSATFRICR